MVSSALDTASGSRWARARRLAPRLEFDCGLGTASLLAVDVSHPPLVPVDGAVEVRRVRPDPELLDRYAATPERTDWWLERVGRAYAVLAAPPTTVE